MAVVGSWLEGDDTSMVNYGNTTVPRSNFITWDQAREMVDSGYVEIASHSYDLHHGIEANPQHNSLPAAISRLYTQGAGYESATAYLKRIRDDLAVNSQIIERHLGRKPRSRRSAEHPNCQFSQISSSVFHHLGQFDPKIFHHQAVNFDHLLCGQPWNIHTNLTLACTLLLTISTYEG